MIAPCSYTLDTRQLEGTFRYVGNVDPDIGQYSELSTASKTG